ncbi:LysR substrate binding domain protein [compost metagenome]
MVEAGAGIAVVPRACAARYSRPDALHVLKLEDPWALRDRLLCRQRGRDLPSFAECFIEHVQRAAARAVGARVQYALLVVPLACAGCRIRARP